jgi:GxxExxY protein
MRITKISTNELAYIIVGCAIEVHKYFGPGLLERDYEEAFIHELKLEGIKHNSQQSLLIPYKDIVLKTELRYDVLVNDQIVVELKSVKEILPIHVSTLLSYMKHLKKPKGLLINFNVVHLYSEGVKSFVNEYYAELPDA